MSTEVKNPPAFPSNWDSSHNSNWMLEQGMELRDYFAAKALTGMLSSTTIGLWSPTELAKNSYELADAMLNERNKNIE